MLRLTIILSVLVCVARPQTLNSCTTPHFTPGKCLDLMKCDKLLSLTKMPILEEVRWYLRESVCSSTGVLPVVCCPEEKPIFSSAPAISRTPGTAEPDVLLSSWLAWSPFTPCTVTCGGGTQARARQRECGQEGECGGEEREERGCGDTECGERTESERNQDAAWSSWGEWSACSVSCSGGRQTRVRECYCYDSVQTGGGCGCEGDVVDVRQCGEEECPTVLDTSSDCEDLANNGFAHPGLNVLCRHEKGNHISK